jgi:hypothetical protein
MGKRKDRKRAEHFIFRDGRYIPRTQWDKYQKDLQDAAEAERLAKIGLVKAKPRIITPEQARKGRRGNP